MLYRRNHQGELLPMEEQKWHVRQFRGQELPNIVLRLTELIEQKGFNLNNTIFSASDLVGNHTIDWENDPALSAIILRYPGPQKTQSNILGRILFQMLFEESANSYEFTKEEGDFHAKYCRL